MNLDDEQILATIYYNRLTEIDKVDSNEALVRCMSMFHCPESFWANIANVKPHNRRDRSMMKFVIAYAGNNPDYHDLFWSNSEGWTDYDFEVFFEEELRLLNLGDDMCWKVYEPGVSAEDNFYVSAYEVERRYGGPEEGGWWYDTGSLVTAVKCNNEEQADYVWDLLTKIYPVTGKRYSVIGGEDYSVSIEKTLIPFFPSERPRYE